MDGDAKYGMTEEQMIDSYKKLAPRAKNFGIHALLASNTISDEYYPRAGSNPFQLAVRVPPVCTSVISISGGVGMTESRDDR